MLAISIKKTSVKYKFDLSRLENSDTKIIKLNILFYVCQINIK